MNKPGKRCGGGFLPSLTAPVLSLGVKLELFVVFVTLYGFTCFVFKAGRIYESFLKVGKEGFSFAGVLPVLPYLIFSLWGIFLLLKSKGIL